MCMNGSAPQINGAAKEVREHLEEAEELLDEMQKANGTTIAILQVIFRLFRSASYDEKAHLETRSEKKDS